LTAASRHLLFSPRQARNASTQSTLPLDASQAGASALPDFSGTPVSLTGSDLLDIPEQLGFLKTLGLDFGWGPTSMMQTVLESIYIYTGLPWWASIGVVAIAVRLALLKPSLDASENAQKHQELMKDPKYQTAVNEMKAMMISGNHLAGAEARARVALMNRAVGFSMWKNFVPLLQLPVGIGMFRLIQGMAHLPVPSFESGGALWFTDLAVADPLFILPALSGIFMMMGMRIPLPYMAPQQAKTMKLFSLAVLPISTIVTLFMPAGLPLYFFYSSVLHFVQSWFTHQPWFRRMIGLRPLTIPGLSDAALWQAPRVVDSSAPRVTSARPAAAPASETMYDSLKSTFSDAKEKLNERADKGEAERTHKAAREYEEKRSLEEKEKTLARLQRRSKGRH